MTDPVTLAFVAGIGVGMWILLGVVAVYLWLEAHSRVKRPYRVAMGIDR